MTSAKNRTARESRLPLQSGLQQVDRAPRWGVGFMLGDPTGLTIKRYLGANAFDATASWADDVSWVVSTPWTP